MMGKPACRLVDAPVPQPYDALKHLRRLAAGGAGNDSHGHMVARVGSSATISREFRQARKGATVAVTSGAGGVLTRAAARTGAGNEAGSGGK